MPWRLGSSQNPRGEDRGGAGMRVEPHDLWKGEEGRRHRRKRCAVWPVGGPPAALIGREQREQANGPNKRGHLLRFQMCGGWSLRAR